MRLIINGEEYDLDVKTLRDVIEHFQLNANLVVTEVDGEIVDRSKWESTTLKEMMKIELVQFVGGG